ncbi:PucR family transcriptional regulator [Nocardia thailandica]
MPTERQLTLDTPIISRAVPRLASVAAELIDAGLAQVPGANELPPGHFSDDFVPAIVAVVSAVLRAVDEQRGIDPDEIAAAVVPVMQTQAEERIPLRLSMLGFFGGVRRFWREINEQAGPDDIDDLYSLSLLLLDLLECLTVTGTAAYAAAEQTVFGAEREMRRELSAALLRGGPAEELAARADVGLADAYDLLSIRVPSAARGAVLADDAITRRRIRIAREVLDDLSGMSPLHTFDGTDGFVLLAAPPDGPDDPRYGSVSRELAQRLDVDVVVIEFHDVPRARIPEAGTQLRELTELAVHLGKPTGTYTIDDLMLEYQLTRPGPARDRLATRLLPLTAHPHLFEALEAHIRFGWDRKRAAQAVHLHPNSFSYRLRRVADLTGFDPTDPNDFRMLAAALTIFRMFPPEA